MKGSPTDAKAYALKLLSYRARSKKEMIERLAGKGFEASRIDVTLKLLEDAGLINDKLLASDLLHYSAERKYLGKRGIRMYLTKRGIDKELTDKTLSAHTAEMEEKAAIEFVERRLRTLRSYPENVIKQRLWGMLQRRGFSFDVIKKAVGSVLKSGPGPE